MSWWVSTITALSQKVTFHYSTTLLPISPPLLYESRDRISRRQALHCQRGTISGTCIYPLYHACIAIDPATIVDIGLV